MTDLRSEFAGLSLPTPLVAAASPLTADDEHVHRLAADGIGAVVLPSLFQEQLEPGPEERARRLDRHNGGVDATLHRVEGLAGSLSVPVVVSLNGTGPGAWTEVAGRCDAAGAAAVELAISLVPTALDVGPGDVEDAVVETAAQVVDHTALPVVVKLVREVAAVGHLGRRLADVGVRGLVLFGRTSMPDLDVETGRPVAVLPLSSPDDLLGPLRWTAVLARRLDVSLAASGGVHCATDVAKALLAGADVVQVASSLLRYGPRHVGVLRAGLARWMAAHGVERLDEVRGSASLAVSDDPALVERAGYISALVEGAREHAGRQAIHAGTSAPRW